MADTPRTFSVQENLINFAKVSPEQFIQRSIEALGDDCKHVVIQAGNFLLSTTKDGEVFPLIPELREDDVHNKEKSDACFAYSGYNTRFSLQSLVQGCALYTELKKREADIAMVLSADDKCLNVSNLGIEKQRDIFFSSGYRSIPNIYREILEASFDGEKNVRKSLRRIPDTLSSTKQAISNPFILSESSLVNRHNKIRNNENHYEASTYKSFKDSLGDNWTSCSLELHHLLHTIATHAQKVFPTRKESEPVGIVQFIPDACEGSAMRSVQKVVADNPHVRIINNVTLGKDNNGYMMNVIVAK